MILYFLLIVLCVCIWYVISRIREPYYRLAKLVPGPKGYPLIGNALDFVTNQTVVTMSKYIDQFGDRTLFFPGPMPALIICNAEDLERICTSTELLTKSLDYELARNWLGDGLVTSSGSHWTHHRKLITPCFHFSVLEQFIGPINKHSITLVSILKENFQGQPEYLDVTPFISRCTFDIICETSMGTQMNSQISGTCAYIQAIHAYGKLFQYRSIRPWLFSSYTWNLTAKYRKEKKILEVIHGFADQVIADRKWKMQLNDDAKSDNAFEQAEISQKVKKPLLDLLLEVQRENKDLISDEGLRDETTTFIFAGHDTVSVAVSFCLHNLGCNPKCQKKLHKELDLVFGEDQERPVTTDDIRKLKYLEFCIKETMRIFPSLPLIGRKATKPFQLDDNTIVPAGTTVYMLLYKLHRNPKYYEKPEEFVPERFDPQSEMYSFKRKSAFTYLPFSAGPRNCVGQKLGLLEAKIVLATVLRKFIVKSEKKIKESELLSEIALRVENGIRVKLKPRN